MMFNRESVRQHVSTIAFGVLALALFASIYFFHSETAPHTLALASGDTEGDVSECGYDGVLNERVERNPSPQKFITCGGFLE